MILDWKKGGILLGVTFFLAVLLVKPIGVSTQFVIFDGVVASQVNKELVVENPESKSGYSSSNAYLNKSGGKYAKNVANPINYGLVFAASMIFGGFIATRKNRKEVSKIPDVHINNFGNTKAKRYLVSFLAGLITLFGVRLAGGCTSGHMMSGMMQTSVSAYIFTMAAFIVAIPVAILVYKK